MVATETLQVILSAKDLLSNKVREVNNTLKQVGASAISGSATATNATNRIGQAYTNLESKVRSVFNNIKNAISNSTKGSEINENGLARPFLNAAEKIRNKWQGLMQNIKGGKAKVDVDTSGMTNAQTQLRQLMVNIQKVNGFKANPRFEVHTIEDADHKVQVLLKDLNNLKNNHIVNVDLQGGGEELNQLNAMIEKIIQRAEKLGNTDITPNINAAGMQVMNAGLTTTSNNVTGLRGRLSNLNSSLISSGTAMKNLGNSSASLGQGFSVLKGALSGVIAMVGYELAANLVESTRASINARGNIESFAQRLNMSKSEVNSFNQELDKLQGEFRKVDMKSVGATALELANKLDVPKNKIADLTRLTAVMSSAFAREGRSSQDAILAVSDALDGQFRRLQEIGITQADLMANGWSGDIADTTSLIDALNKTMEELGIEETARQVTNLDDAWAVLNVAMSQLITEILIPLTPILVGLIMAFADLAGAISNWWKNMPDAGKLGLITFALTALAVVIYTHVVTSLEAMEVSLATVVTTALPLIAVVLEIALVVGIIAVAIYECGIAMGWWTDGASAMQVIGNALNNALTQIGECLKIVYNGMMEVINPVIQEFWSQLVTIVQPLKKEFEELWNSLVELGDAFGGASGSGTLFADIGRLIGTILTNTITVIKVAVAVIIPFVTFIVDVAGSIITFLISVKEAFDLLMQGDILGFLNLLGQAISTLMMNVIIGFGTMLLQILMNFNTIFGGILLSVWNWLVQLASMMLMGGYNAIVGFLTWISQLPWQFYNYLLIAWNSFTAWASNIINKAIETGSSMVTNFISWISSLPSKFWSWLLSTINKINDFKSQGVQKIKDTAKQMLDGFVSWIKSLPSKMGEYLNGIKQEIWNRSGGLVSAIMQLGWNMLNSFKDALLGTLGWNSAEVNNAGNQLAHNFASMGYQLTSTGSLLGKQFADSIATGINAQSIDNIGISNNSSILHKVEHEITLNKQDKQTSLLEDILSALGNLSVTHTGSIDFNQNVDVTGGTSLNDNELKEAVMIALQDKNILKQIVNSREFQTMDQKMKQRMIKEIGRHI